MNAPTLSDAHVLLVDDHADLRNTLRVLLELKGYGVRTADNGAQALSQMKRNPVLPSLVITDLRMPVCDGWKLRQKMLDDPNLAGVPVAIVSATVPDFSTRNLNVVAYLQKPAPLSSLLQLIRRYIKPVR